MFVLSDSVIAGKVLTIKLPRQLSFKGSSLLKEGTWSLSQAKTDRVQRAKDIVSKVKELEENNMPDKAEAELQKIIPVL